MYIVHVYLYGYDSMTMTLLYVIHVHHDLRKMLVWNDQQSFFPAPFLYNYPFCVCQISFIVELQYNHVLN